MYQKLARNINIVQTKYIYLTEKNESNIKGNN